jgi:broad-specificity NMP kinase
MAIMFITGLSGVGKSSVLEYLSIKGYPVVDTDYGFTKLDEDEIKWDEDKIIQLITQYKNKPLILSGCYSNQGKFYSYFDSIILLTAELDVMLERVEKRKTNPYGKNTADRNEIIESYEIILPLLKKRATVMIDTTVTSIEEVCEQLIKLLH